MHAQTRKLPRAQSGTRNDRIAFMIVAAGAALWCTSRAVADCGAEVMGRWGGQTFAVATDGATAFAGRGLTLLAVDISDPARPLELGQLYMGGQILQIRLADDLAYVACEEGGLQVVDVSDPARPVRVGAYSDYVCAVSVRDNFAFVLSDQLSVLDISDPTTPVLIGEDLAPTGATDFQSIEISGQYAFVPVESTGVFVYDISEPALTHRVAVYPLNDNDLNVTGLTVSGDFLYVLTWYDRLLIFDVTDPLAAFLVSTTTLGEEVLPFDIAVRHGTAIVACADESIRIVDISNPEAPVELPPVPAGRFSVDVAVTDDTVVVADIVSGLIVYQLTPSGGLHEQGRLDFATRVTNVAADGRYAYVHSWQEGSVVLDIQNPEQPQMRGIVSDTFRFGFASTADGYLYTIDYFRDLSIYDVSDPDSPVLLGSVETPVYVDWIDVKGTYVFVAGGSSGQDAAIIDVSDPTAPVVVSSIDAYDRVDAAGLNGDVWYLSTRSGLEIFDVSNPEAPASLGLFPHLRFDAIAFSGDIAFMAGAYLRVVDLAIPSNPMILQTWYQWGERFSRVDIAGAYLVADVENYRGQVAVFVIDDPLDPQLIAWIPEVRETLAIADNLAMLREVGEGLMFLRLGDPADLNLDTRVDLHDLTMLLSHFGMSGTVRRTDGDIDGDGDVDAGDLAQLLANYGGVCG